MPNGHRRGGTYTRNGHTFTRRGTSIKAPRTLMVAAGIGVGAAALFGSGSALTIGVAVVGVGAVVAWRYRRQLRPVTRALKRKAKKTTRKYEVFYPASGTTVKTVRTEWGAKRATKNNDRDYAPAGEGWPPEPEPTPDHPEAQLEDPDTWWKTGGEPVTENQWYTLTKRGIDPEGMTKAEASKAIARGPANTSHKLSADAGTMPVGGARC